MTATHNTATDSYDKIGCLVLSGLFAGLLGLLLLYANIAGRFSCVEMPNGLLIGQATVFSKMHGRGGAEPDIALKFPDGRILRRGDGNIRFYDSESIGGIYPNDKQRRSDNFVYIKDVGVFIESEQPEQFQFYRDKKMAELAGMSPTNSNGRASSVNSNLFHIYLTLQKNRNTHRKWCPTAWTLP
ncbi:hypothetical protein [Maritalea mediterranea]|uniref:Uncharacterized protein n=1 Tax=Maritalea mediterranea TaxID=2909667 RepID=A0ABS9E5Y0_9HYPH|nr:hypothetical protein [Maritalea mediterranea]MCF4097304.1 hypothetical protein [Maritalea mediterranea]